MIGTTAGAFSTSFLKIYKLAPLNYIQLICITYLICVAVSEQFPITDLAMTVVVAVLAVLSGLITTMNYLLGDKVNAASLFDLLIHPKPLQIAKEAGLDASFNHSVRQYIAMANQTGVIIGSYLCVAVVAADAFFPKEEMKWIFFKKNERVKLKIEEKIE